MAGNKLYTQMMKMMTMMMRRTTMTTIMVIMKMTTMMGLILQIKCRPTLLTATSMCIAIRTSMENSLIRAHLENSSRSYESIGKMKIALT